MWAWVIQFGILDWATESGVKDLETGRALCDLRVYYMDQTDLNQDLHSRWGKRQEDIFS